MALAIVTNNAALRAAAAASGVNRDMETSMARLSSGKRINSASDDAAGVAISSRLTSNIRGIDQAIRNALDGQALIDTAEGAHKEIENILQRMREAALQGANDTNNVQDRSNLQVEFDALIVEIDRIAGTTTWAGNPLISSGGSDLSFQIRASSGSKDQLKVSVADVGAAALGLGGELTTKSTAFEVNRETKTTNTATGEVTTTSSTAIENTEPTAGISTTSETAYVTTALTPTAVGSEFNATTFAAPSQDNVSISAFSDGSFVQIYQTHSQDGSGFGIHGQIFDVSGAKVGPEFQINTHTTNNQLHPEVTVLADDSFAVIWSSQFQDGDGYGVMGRIFEKNGTVSTNEFQVNTYTSGNQGDTVQNDRPDGGADTAIESLATGGFVATWKSQGQDSSGHGVYGQIFDRQGLKVGNEFRINTYTNQDQIEPAMTRLSNGNFVVSWSSMRQDSSNEGVFGQIFDPAGSKIGSEFQINTVTARAQNRATLANLSSGGFVTTWSGTDVDGTGVIGQIFDSSGAKVGLEFQINTHTASDQTNPSVSGLEDGGFVVAWESRLQDGSQTGVYAQRYDSGGQKVGSEFQVNSHTNSYQHNAFVETLSGGDFIVSWQSNGQAAAYFDIFSQVFSTTNSFEATISVETTVNPVTTSSTSNLENLSILSNDYDLQAVTTIDLAIKTVNAQRAHLGAISNRLNHTVNNLTNISANLSAAKGGIEDADFALETTSLAKNQILQQASTAMLAQANASKQNVLSLLQG